MILVVKMSRALEGEWAFLGAPVALIAIIYYRIIILSRLAIINVSSVGAARKLGCACNCCQRGLRHQDVRAQGEHEHQQWLWFCSDKRELG